MSPGDRRSKKGNDIDDSPGILEPMMPWLVLGTVLVVGGLYQRLRPERNAEVLKSTGLPATVRAVRLMGALGIGLGVCLIVGAFVFG
jgi:hypothetical protein